MTNIYHINNSIRLTATFTIADVPTDPTYITLKVLDPTGYITTYTYALGEITKSSTGIYYREILSNASGEWHYEWIGTGSVLAADEDYYIIEHSKF